MNQIHVTSLGTFNTCPFKFKYDKTPIELINTIPGDILNIAVGSQGDITPFLDDFTNNFKGDFKLRKMLEVIYAKARERVKEMKAKYPELWQETKMFHRVNDELIIVGTPDIFYKDENGDMVVADWKTGASHSRYKGDDIWNESLQPVIYSMFIMDYFKVDKVKFKYMVYSKANGECLDFERDFNRTEVEAKVKQVVDDYELSEFSDNWKPQSCRYCSGMCPLRKNGECPMYTRKISEI